MSTACILAPRAAACQPLLCLRTRKQLTVRIITSKRSCGLMDKALVFGTKDCRFESCQDHSSCAAALHHIGASFPSRLTCRFAPGPATALPCCASHAADQHQARRARPPPPPSPNFAKYRLPPSGAAACTLQVWAGRGGREGTKCCLRRLRRGPSCVSLPWQTNGFSCCSTLWVWDPDRTTPG